MFSTKKKGALSAVLALWLGVGITQNAHADATLTGEKTTDQLKFGGDMRIRQENFFNKSLNAVDRSRQRYRLRFGVTGTIQDITAAFRLASGTGEQVSTNQTFGNAYGEKGVYIDQAYLSWKAHEYLRLTGGRMANPFWRNYSSDLMWDDDINPEGIAEQIEMPASDRISVFANFAQLPINEISNSTQDPWVFGNQIGAQVKITEDTKVKAGFSYYGFINENKQVLLSTAAADSAVIQEANTLVPASGDKLAGTYKLTLYTVELNTHLGALPVSLQGDFLRNVAPGSSVTGYANHANNGYQLGTVLGKAKNAGTWEFAYFYKYQEANSAISAWADSDFGNGGTNRRGHILWLSYAPRDYVTIKGKYFMTRKVDPFISSSAPFAKTSSLSYSDINRFQLDVVVKF